MKRTIALTLLFFASVIVLALNKVADTDAWMHLSMGRLIWQTGGLPAADPYVFTNEGLPFTYSSWLFGLALYGIMQAGGTAGLVLAKAAVAAALFTILLRDALRPYRNHAVALGADRGARAGPVALRRAAGLPGVALPGVQHLQPQRLRARGPKIPLCPSASAPGLGEQAV